MRNLLAALALATLGASAGCAGDRPFVLSSATKLGDLYWRGELTDERGNRWNIKLIQGIVPPIEDAADAFVDAGDFADDALEATFWANRGEDISDGIEFAFEDSLGDFMLGGIGRDAAETTARLAELTSEAPFGWIPRVIARAAWGYVVKPAGRLVLGPTGCALGLGYAAAAPVCQVAARPVGGAFWAAGGGVALPAARIAVHQPMYAFAILNREPAEKHDGSFGLAIVERARPEEEVVPQADVAEWEGPPPSAPPPQYQPQREPPPLPPPPPECPTCRRRL